MSRSILSTRFLYTVLNTRSAEITTDLSLQNGIRPYLRTDPRPIESGSTESKSRSRSFHPSEEEEDKQATFATVKMPRNVVPRRIIGTEMKRIMKMAPRESQSSSLQPKANRHEELQARSCVGREEKK